MITLDPAIALTPRTHDQNVDLGMLIHRQYLGEFLRIWAICVFPACVATYALGLLTSQGLLFGIGIFLMASGPLGILTAATTFQLLRGQTCQLPAAWGALGPYPHLLMLRSLGMALLQFLLLGCGLIPGVLLMNRESCFIEEHLFRLHFSLHGDRNLRGRSERLHSRTNQDGAGISLFWFALWLMILFSVDFLTDRLLGIPLMLGRVGVDVNYSGFDGLIAAFWSFLVGDPFFSTLLVATALLAFQVVRIGWFLNYCDDRIRRECFDVELRIRAEVERLAPASR